MNDIDLHDPIDHDLRRLAIDAGPFDAEARDHVRSSLMDRLDQSTSGRSRRRRLGPLIAIGVLGLGSVAAASAWWLGMLDDTGCGTPSTTAETVARATLSNGHEVELLVFRPAPGQPPNGTGVASATGSRVVVCQQLNAPDGAPPQQQPNISLHPVEGLVVTREINVEDRGVVVETHGPVPAGATTTRVTWTDGVETEPTTGDGWWLGVREVPDIGLDDNGYPAGIPRIVQLQFLDARGEVLLVNPVEPPR